MPGSILATNPRWNRSRLKKPKVAAKGAPVRRYKAVDRSVHELRVFELDALIEEDHSARALVEFVDSLDLSSFEENCKAWEGQAGQSPFAAAVLIALWLQACTDGVGSARELSRRCAHHPVYRWLCGDAPINHHTLSDFRVKRKEALDHLFVEVLGVLNYKGLIRLERVTQDGTKIRALASPGSFHREKTLEDSYREAEDQVKAMADVPEEPAGERGKRRRVEERAKLLEQARKILREQQEKKTKQKDRDEVRVSTTEPDARKMRMPDKSYGPAYNGQITTDADHGIIVGAAVTQDGGDYDQLVPALEAVKERFGQMPGQMLVDGGYVSRKNILEVEGRTDLIGPWDEEGKDAKERRRRAGISEDYAPKVFVFDPVTKTFQCPAGCTLRKRQQRPGPGKIEHIYQAEASDCGRCERKGACCPGSKARQITRIEEHVAVERFRKKMASEECKAIYKKRSQVAEFSNCWLKQKFGLRRFHVRGLVKVGMELTWHVIAYNFQQWLRLIWRPERQTVAA